MSAEPVISCIWSSSWHPHSRREHAIQRYSLCRARELQQRTITRYRFRCLLQFVNPKVLRELQVSQDILEHQSHQLSHPGEQLYAPRRDTRLWGILCNRYLTCYNMFLGLSALSNIVQLSRGWSLAFTTWTYTRSRPLPARTLCVQALTSGYVEQGVLHLSSTGHVPMSHIQEHGRGPPAGAPQALLVHRTISPSMAICALQLTAVLQRSCTSHLAYLVQTLGLWCSKAACCPDPLEKQQVWCTSGI